MFSLTLHGTSLAKMENIRRFIFSLHSTSSFPAITMVTNRKGSGDKSFSALSSISSAVGGHGRSICFLKARKNYDDKGEQGLGTCLRFQECKFVQKYVKWWYCSCTWAWMKWHQICHDRPSWSWHGYWLSIWMLFSSFSEEYSYPFRFSSSTYIKCKKDSYRTQFCWTTWVWMCSSTKISALSWLADKRAYSVSFPPSPLWVPQSNAVRNDFKHNGWCLASTAKISLFFTCQWSWTRPILLPHDSICSHAFSLIFQNEKTPALSVLRSPSLMSNLS